MLYFRADVQIVPLRFIMKFVEFRHNLQVEWGSRIAKDIHHPPAG